MNTKKSNSLIFYLADKRGSITSMTILMPFGGIGSFVWNVIKGNFREAIFAPASNLYCIAGAAQAKINNGGKGVVQTLWRVLLTLSLFQAACFGIAARLVLAFTKGETASEYDVVGANLQEIWGFPHMALRIVCRGLEQFPNDCILVRRKLHCLIAIEAQPQHIYDDIKSLETVCEAQPDEMRHSFVESIIGAYRYLGRSSDVARWTLYLKEEDTTFIKKWAKAKTEHSVALKP